MLFFICCLAATLVLRVFAGESYAGRRGEHARAVVSEIKHWSNPNYTRIVITVSKKASYASRLLKKDPSINMAWRRLYIDINGATLGAGLKKEIPINDGLLKMARAGQYNNDTVRVVLDIESIEDFKIFPLDDDFYKIVIDVTGEKRQQSADSGQTTEKPVRKSAEKMIIAQSPSISRQLGLKVRTIVIDPGHGGKDPGAIGIGGLKEKDVTLRIARMLRDKLASTIHSKIIMTRDRDVFIPLEERTAIANSRDADLFISVHINSNMRRAASGVETYTLNISNDEEAKRVAARENSTSRRSVSDLEFILNDLIKTAKSNDSIGLATAVHESLVKKLKDRFRDIRSNGVKGAPFYVLVGTKMPSILCEVSFISNPVEEKRLQDENYLRQIVDGIAAGVMRYMNETGSV
jgi:N-acetylmuramoyl-L-alanine amidase